MFEDTTMITKERYKQLLKSELKLEMLEKNSVECWRDYDSALLDEDKYYGYTYDEMCVQIDKWLADDEI